MKEALACCLQLNAHYDHIGWINQSTNQSKLKTACLTSQNNNEYLAALPLILDTIMKTYLWVIIAVNGHLQSRNSIYMMNKKKLCIYVCEYILLLIYLCTAHRDLFIVTNHLALFLFGIECGALCVIYLSAFEHKSSSNVHHISSCSYVCIFVSLK